MRGQRSRCLLGREKPRNKARAKIWRSKGKEQKEVIKCLKTCKHCIHLILFLWWINFSVQANQWGWFSSSSCLFFLVSAISSQTSSCLNCRTSSRWSSPLQRYIPKYTHFFCLLHPIIPLNILMWMWPFTSSLTRSRKVWNWWIPFKVMQHLAKQSIFITNKTTTGKMLKIHGQIIFIRGRIALGEEEKEKKTICNRVISLFFFW